FGPGAAAIVPVTISTDHDIDAQQVVLVNGRVIRRSRDSFGRALTGGPTGLLETQTIDADTWVPTDSRTMTLSLDPSRYGRHFPEIQIKSPAGVVLISDLLNKGAIKVGGVPFNCQGTNCFRQLPPLGYLKGTIKQPSVWLWHAKDEIDKGAIDKGARHAGDKL